MIAADSLRIALFLPIALLSLPLAAQQDALTTEELLASSERHYPDIIRSLAQRRAAQGRSLEAAGAFDLVFRADGFSRASGFYDGQAVSATVSKRLRPLGASIYGGYKLSSGDFPVYEDASFTNSGGSLRLGMLFSLIRDRDIDPERFAMDDAGFAIRDAELDILLTKIGVQQRALVAYWEWVLAGRQLRIFENLLRIADDRQDGLETQVGQGARAEIFLTENQQNITRREILVTRARRDLALAANSLSMFYRDELGQPVVPTPARLPPGEPLSEIDVGSLDARSGVEDAVSIRPELARLRNAIEREQRRLALLENDLKPELDVRVELQTGLGAVAEGGPSRDSTDTVVGFSFSVPLERRSEQGRLEQSRAELDAKQAEQQQQREQIALEVRNLILDLRFARELLTLAAQEVRQSEIMRAAELRRFQSGASDFFLVNLREETAADARIRLNEAEYRIRLARANYDAATANLDRLGISTAKPLLAP